jgi:hypothetical protein
MVIFHSYVSLPGVSIKWGIDDIEVIEALGISGRGQSCQPNMDYDER